MLRKDDTAFVLVDVQGKLAQIVHESEELLKNVRNLIEGLRLLDIPILWLEQNPKGLGPTTDSLAEKLEGLEPIPKMNFSACQNETFMESLQETGRKQILVAGIETHICVYQTAMELDQLEYEVQIVADAVSSRTEANKIIGIEKMKMAGIPATSVEMALYEMMKTAEHKQFKNMLKCIK